MVSRVFSQQLRVGWYHLYEKGGDWGGGDVRQFRFQDSRCFQAFCMLMSGTRGVNERNVITQTRVGLGKDER